MSTKLTKLKVEPVVTNESTKVKVEPVVTNESANVKVEPVVSNESSKVKVEPVVSNESTNVKVEPVVTNESANVKVEPVVSNESSKVKVEPVVSNESTNVKVEPLVSNESSKVKVEPLVSDESSDDDDVTTDSGNEDLGLPMDKLNLGPKKKLLVLCLGGLLVHRVHKRNSRSVPRNCRADFVYGNFLIFKRPFCDEFLKFCFERFEVALWSSAMEHNVGTLLCYLLKELKPKLLFQWDQAECTNSGFECLGKAGKPIFFKELKEVWKKISPRGNFSAANTLLVDNDPYKGLLNPPHTAIYPEQYTVGNKEDRFLAPGGELQLFLDGVADVPTYVKEHRVWQSEITASHSDWYFYSKILAHFGKRDGAY